MALEREGRPALTCGARIQGQPRFPKNEVWVLAARLDEEPVRDKFINRLWHSLVVADEPFDSPSRGMRRGRHCDEHVRPLHQVREAQLRDAISAANSTRRTGSA